MINHGRLWSTLATVLAAAMLSGCGQNQASGPPQHAVAIQKGDVCAVCGMYIRHYPGPRAEAYVEGRAKPLKFGSTRDFFAYALQPDHKTQLQSLFVQDTARIEWAHPSDKADSFVDARKAYYVAWQPLHGAMGPTLASFAKEADAEAYVQEHGGKLLTFDQVTAVMISALAPRCPEAAQAAELGAQGCTASPANPRKR